ncbi:MAG: hypothetical protein WCX17_03945, partial [Parcubacteria group bacterium]
MKNKITSSFIFLTLLCLFFALGYSALAQTATNEQQATVVANVNIYSAQIISQDGKNIKIGFDLNNQDFVQPDVKYAVVILKIDGKGQTIADQVVYDETLNLGIGETTHKEITYAVPNYLSGEYEVWVESRTTSGLPLGQGKAGDITLNGDNQYVEIISTSCYLTIQGDESGKKYTLRQGVDISSAEKLISTCDVVNHFDTGVNLSPKFTTYWRTVFGKTVEDNNEPQAEVALSPQEKKTISFIIPGTSIPQAYDAKLALFKDGQSASNSVIFHYVLQGSSATIQNLRIDKDKYQKGDVAQASFSWTPSADSFPGSRFGTSNLGDISAQIDLKGSQNVSCASPINKKITDHNIEVSVPIVENCTDPQITVALKNAQGNTLDQKTFEIKSKISPIATVPTKPGGNVWKIIIILVVVILVVIVILIIFKRKNRKTIMPVIFLVFSLGIYASCTHVAKAVTWAVDDWDTATFTANINKSTYSPGEAIQVTGQGSIFVCDNGTDSISLTETTNGVEKYLFNKNNLSYGFQTYFGSATATAPTTPGNYVVHMIGRASLLSRSADIPYTVVAPPTCSISYSPGTITSPGSSTATVTMNNTTSATYGCTGPQPVAAGTGLGVAASATYVFTFPAGQTGTETCTASVSGPGGTGTCSGSVVVNPPSSCNLPWGGTIASGASVTAYQSSSVACGSSCVSQTRTCNNGVLSGSYTNQNCTGASCSCTLPWGGTLANGSSVTAYQASSVPCGSTCTSQTRTCNNGTLSGTYTNQACSVSGCLSCTRPCGGSVVSGNWGALCYQASSVPCGSSCSSSQGYCNNGLWTTPYAAGSTAASCSVAACPTCTLPWGGTIANGSGVTAYQSSSVACGSSCTSQTRTCNNGVLSGTYTNQACSVAACSCTLPWGGTLANGSSVTAYQAGSVPCGSTCTSQTRTCNSGVLSGSYTSQACSVAGCTSCVSPCGLAATASGNWGVNCYQALSVPCGSICSASTGYCNNGSWTTPYTSGYAAGSCNVAACASCVLPWGGSIPSGNTVVGYQASSVPCGSSCSPQVRTCTNGVLSGSYANQNCSATGCLGCTAPWGTAMVSGG